MSPKRCLFIHIDDDSVSNVITVEGDQRIRDESVDVERRVGIDKDAGSGRQESEVMPASWPTRRASNVIENCCALI